MSVAGLGDVTVDVLDGRDSIGGSKILIGWGGEGVFLDFGINYGHWGRYFEEYVKPRVTQGLADLWKLGMVPRLNNLYRRDVVPPGLQKASELPVNKVSAVYVSHAHLDHGGLIGLLDPSIPMVASRTSAAILKAVQDTAPSNIFQQAAYSSPMKEGIVANQHVFRSDESKPFVGRDLLVTDGLSSQAFDRFWSDPPSRPHLSKSKTPPRALHAGSVSTLQPSSGGVHARAHVVDHSVLGAAGYTIETPQGPIVYSGDLRAQGKHAEDSRAFLNSIERRRPWILLMEGTQVREHVNGDEGFSAPTTEEDVERNSLAVVERYRGKLVIADFGPRNIERLQSFFRIAKRTGRTLVIMPKDAYLLHAMHASDPTVPLPGDEGMLVFDPPSATEPAGWERFILHEYQTQVINLDQLRQRHAEIILCFSVWDVKHLLDVMPEGGVYIYSSSEAHSEEAEIDMERLYNWITFFGLDVVGFRMEPYEGKRRKFRPVGEKGFHASGHMPGHEILEWVERIRPEYLIPIHTEGGDAFRRRFEGTGIQILPGSGTPR